MARRRHRHHEALPSSLRGAERRSNLQHLDVNPRRLLCCARNDGTSRNDDGSPSPCRIIQRFLALVGGGHTSHGGQRLGVQQVDLVPVKARDF